MAKVMLIDTTKCYGCQNCDIACKSEFVGISTETGFVGNDYSPYAAPQPDSGHHWMRVDYNERGSYPKVRIVWTATPCMHCDNAPCIAASTGGAVYKRSDGIVIIDPVKSVGQKQIVASCPYGAIYWNSTLNIPQKCTFCAHILDNPNLDSGSATPRCVFACAVDAITFGEYSDLQQTILQGGFAPMHPEYGTQPRVFYKGLPKRFLTGAVYDPTANENIVGATVTLTDPDSGDQLMTTTDRFGDFWFEGLGANRNFVVFISAKGMATMSLGADTATDRDLGSIPLRKSIS